MLSFSGNANSLPSKTIQKDNPTLNIDENCVTVSNESLDEEPIAAIKVKSSHFRLQRADTFGLAQDGGILSHQEESSRENTHD